MGSEGQQEKTTWLLHLFLDASERYCASLGNFEGVFHFHYQESEASLQRTAQHEPLS